MSYFPNSSNELIVCLTSSSSRAGGSRQRRSGHIMSLIPPPKQQLLWHGNEMLRYPGPRRKQLGEPDRAAASKCDQYAACSGEQQVLLKVCASLNSAASALRELGLDFSVTKDNFSISSTHGNAVNLVALLDGTDVSLMLRAVSSNGYTKFSRSQTLSHSADARRVLMLADNLLSLPQVGISGVRLPRPRSKVSALNCSSPPPW